MSSCRNGERVYELCMHGRKGDTLCMGVQLHVSKLGDVRTLIDESHIICCILQTS